ncbi:thymidine-kinase [Harp seal herpesvirus]|uniref:Thymidine-kinase n=1 Tax=phocid gammaherpesvirus 3 TaxID=2560643 RepID=A0A0R5Z8S7_9GAMA|nr:thymidine-kinase [Harp seal herpesvirus]AJG42947.1 thymidine-kinase [Harp seal herpesvirus]
MAEGGYSSSSDEDFQFPPVKTEDGWRERDERDIRSPTVSDKEDDEDDFVLPPVKTKHGWRERDESDYDRQQGSYIDKEESLDWEKLFPKFTPPEDTTPPPLPVKGKARRASYNKPSTTPPKPPRPNAPKDHRTATVPRAAYNATKGQSRDNEGIYYAPKYYPKHKPKKTEKRLVKVQQGDSGYTCYHSDDFRTQPNTSTVNVLSESGEYAEIETAEEQARSASPELLDRQEDDDDPNTYPTCRVTDGGGAKSKLWLQKKIPKPKSGNLQSLSMKKLSSSLKSLMNTRMDLPASKDEAEQAAKNALVIETMLTPNPTPKVKSAFFLFIDGCIGVGKTTLINYLKKTMSYQNIVTFDEPMVFWKNIFSNCVENIYECTRPHKAGRTSTSCKVFSCQTKFLTPLKNIHTSAYKYACESNRLRVKNNMDNWILFDRHLLSATVAFPLMQFNCGFLNAEHFLELLAQFTARDTDTIALITMSEYDNIEMVKKRGRKFEKNVDAVHLKKLAEAFSMTYRAWILLQYFEPEDIMKVITSSMSLITLCEAKKMKPDRVKMVYKTFSRSLFVVLREILNEIPPNCTIIQVCLTLCAELKKLQIILVDASNHIDDIPGIWTQIYVQALRIPAVRTQTVDWDGLKQLSQAYND